jgi:hypothetical protein
MKRPKPRPTSKLAPKRSPMSPSRAEGMAMKGAEREARRTAKEDEPLRRAKGGMVKTYAKGGMCRGAGAAKRGRGYSKSG